MGSAAEQESYKRIIAVAETVNLHLEKIYNSDLAQAKQWLNFTLISGALSFLTLLAIIFALISRQISLGLATGALNLLTDTFAIFFAKQLGSANKQVLNDREKLSSTREIFLAIELAQTMNPKIRDHYKGLLIVRLSGLVKGQDIPVLDLMAREQKTPPITGEPKDKA